MNARGTCARVQSSWAFSLALVMAILLILSWVPLLVSADRGGIPLPATPDTRIQVFEPGQKAIIAWNGQEEILILSTDVKANQSTLVLELLPLPSNPKAIERANSTSFIKLQEIIQRHMLSDVPWESHEYLKQSNFEEAIVITFHEKIGAHDVTVVKAENASKLALWIDDFLRRNFVANEFSIQEYEAIFNDYISRNFQYFALDLVEVSPEERSVEPILYHFETKFLYYPLKISTLFSGTTGIKLFILSPHNFVDFIEYFSIVQQPWASSLVYIDKNMTKAYAPANFSSWSFSRPVQFNLTNDELREIDVRLDSLFNGSAVLTLLHYRGGIQNFTGDLILREGEALVVYPFLSALPFTYARVAPLNLTNLKIIPSNFITIKTLEGVKIVPPSQEFIVLVDYYSPVIGSIDFSILMDGSVSIQCKVEDTMSGVSEVTLFYQVVGGEWKNCKMIETDDKFVATIPLETDENLNFYIEASDLVGNKAVEDNGMTYFLVDVNARKVSLILRNVSLVASCILAAGLIAFIAKVFVEKRRMPHGYFN